MLNKQLLERVQIVALVISLAGGAFKLMHWPGANIMLILGLGTLVQYYIITALIPSTKSPKAVLVGYSRNFSIAVLLAGLLFYIMHWPGANVMLMAGTGGVVLSFLLQIASGAKDEEE